MTDTNQTQSSPSESLKEAHTVAQTEGHKVDDNHLYNLSTRINLLKQEANLEAPVRAPESKHTSLKVTFTGPELRAFKALSESLKVSDNTLIAHAIAGLPIDLAKCRREKRITTTAIEKIMLNSRSNFAQLESFIKDGSNSILEQRRVKIEFALRKISEAFYTIIERSNKTVEVVDLATTNKDYAQALELYKTENINAVLKFHEVKKNRALNQHLQKQNKKVDQSRTVNMNTNSKNYRVDRTAAEQFKESKNTVYGKRSLVSQGLIPCFENLKLLSVEYQEATTFHRKLLIALHELNGHFKSRTISMAVDTDNEHLIEKEFKEITLKLQAVYNILIENIPKI